MAVPGLPVLSAYILRDAVRVTHNGGANRRHVFGCCHMWSVPGAPTNATTSPEWAMMPLGHTLGHCSWREHLTQRVRAGAEISPFGCSCRLTGGSAGRAIISPCY